ncbi:MAG: hypothetical protein ABIN94_15620 [Ferruginibacter sp.]
MKKSKLVIFLFCLLFLPAIVDFLYAQEGCVLQPPILRIDFGNNKMPSTISSKANYREVYGSCPQDGSYALATSTSDCFGGHWITLMEDHTEGDDGGKMLLVNAAYTPSLFFATPLRGLLPGTTYEFAIWIVNVCKPGYDCTDNRPNLRFVIENISGQEVAKFLTGNINPTGSPTWLQYTAMFKTPADGGTLYLKVENKEEGGCGNDFAMDDITISECVMRRQVVKAPPPVKPIVKKTPALIPSIVKKTPPEPTIIKKVPSQIPMAIIKDTPRITRPVIGERVTRFLPKLIQSRLNPVVKQIETGSGDILVELYDNGEIDGDTVSIYHNNSLIVSRAGLSAKPVTFHVAIDPDHPHHELVMVANNLGSIPPNTSLMIVTAQNKRYEIFISSTEQKNAKVIIDLK